MSMRALLLTMLLSAAVWLCTIAAPATAARVGPLLVGVWRPIKDVSDPNIQEIGGWAVAEHVKKVNDGLRFSKVVSGEEQVVSGMIYKLVLHATDGTGKSAVYGAAVYEQEWTKTRELLSFLPAN